MAIEISLDTTWMIRIDINLEEMLSINKLYTSGIFQLPYIADTLCLESFAQFSGKQDIAGLGFGIMDELVVFGRVTDRLQVQCLEWHSVANRADIDDTAWR